MSSTEDALKLTDDPRPMDRVLWHRLRLVLEDELCDRAWGCSLYRLNRTGRIDNDQREAGDLYWRIYNNFVETQNLDPDLAIPEAKEFTLKKIERAKRKFYDAKDILGLYYHWVHRVVWDDEWPTSERAHMTVNIGLRMLGKYLQTGNRKSG